MLYKSREYLVWVAKEIDHACHLSVFAGYEDTDNFYHGVPILKYFPDGVVFFMNRDYPYHMLLTDTLLNTDQLLVVSDKEKVFLEDKKPPFIEYLPVRVVNHKNKIIKLRYWILHPIDPVDCIDIERSSVIWSEIDEDAIDDFESLVFDEKRVDASRLIFRLKHLGNVVLINRALAKEMDAIGFTGNEWIELADYTSEEG